MSWGVAMRPQSLELRAENLEGAGRYGEIKYDGK